MYQEKSVFHIIPYDDIIYIHIYILHNSDIEMIVKLNRQTYVPRIRCKNYVEQIVSSYSEMEFKMHFR